MAENKLKTEETAAPNNAPPPKKKKGLLDSFNLNAFILFKNIYFIFYIAFLGIIYIANSHYAMKTIKEIKKTQAILQKISWESHSRKSELMLESMQSRVSAKVHHLGLHELTENPKKIIVKK